MEKDRKLKLTAAIAAVLHYEAETELLGAGVLSAPPERSREPAIPVWSLAGRQDGMMMRSLWQRRMGR